MGVLRSPPLRGLVHCGFFTSTDSRLTSLVARECIDEYVTGHRVAWCVRFRRPPPDHGVPGAAPTLGEFDQAALCDWQVRHPDFWGASRMQSFCMTFGIQGENHVDRSDWTGIGDLLGDSLMSA